MEFVNVNKENISTLYELNRKLAIEEGQAELFTAKLEEYSKGFLTKCPIVYGTLCYNGGALIGFSICNYKFSTYLGCKVLYIEDMFIVKEFRTRENVVALIRYLCDNAFRDNCVRVEMRVLNKFNLGIDLLEELGFQKIEKWSVYRLFKN